MEAYKKAQAGDAAALAMLMRKHASLVQALSSRFEQRQDAFQAGCIGLMKAIRGFDEKLGYAFSTYAVPLILGEMRRTRPRQFNWRQQKKLNAANRFRDEQIKKYGREPAISEMAKRAGMEQAELALLLESSKCVYLSDGQETLLSFPDPESDRWLQRFFIRDILERMPTEYSYILKRRYMANESQLALSARLNVRQSTLSRTEKKARLMFISAWQG